MIVLLARFLYTRRDLFIALARVLLLLGRYTCWMNRAFYITGKKRASNTADPIQLIRQHC